MSNFTSKLLVRDLLPASKLSGNSDPRVQFQIQVAGARSIACKQTFQKQRSPCPILDPSCWRAIYCLQANFRKQRSPCPILDPSCWCAIYCLPANFLETAIPVSNFRSKLLARDLLPASKLSRNSDPRVQFQIQVAGARSIACKQTFQKQRSPCPILDPSCWHAIYCLQANFLETAIPVFHFTSKLLARGMCAPATWI